MRTIVCSYFCRLCVWCANGSCVEQIFSQVRKLCTSNIAQNAHIQRTTTITLEFDLKQIHNQLNKNERMTGTKQNEPNGMHGLSLGFLLIDLCLGVLCERARVLLSCVFSAFINRLTIYPYTSRFVCRCTFSSYGAGLEMEMKRKLKQMIRAISIQNCDGRARKARLLYD